jgi:uncharacterized membrane protein YtjA (UPF0391 family)
MDQGLRKDYSIRWMPLRVPQYGDWDPSGLKQRRIVARFPNEGPGLDARFRAKVNLTGTHKEVVMLRWALGFFILALIAAVLGFSGVALAAAGIAKIIFFIFLVLFLVSLMSHLLRRT